MWVVLDVEEPFAALDELERKEMTVQGEACARS
jgi:ABC-type nitrate/sulfonate/bicarbonate transport system ATPase subunit